MERLNEHTLAHCAPAFERPRYKRSELRTGHLHLGLGAFHRAHQALYTESVLNQTGDLRWGIAGVSLRSPEVAARLLPQDRLFTVLERHGDRFRGRLIGALTAAWHAPSQRSSVLSAMADPAVKVISLTVTEKAYGVNPATGTLDVNHPDVAADLKGQTPMRSVLGLLCDGLTHRPDGALLNVLCCDNMNRNGELLRGLMLEFAQIRSSVSPGLVERIRNQLSFPNTMVDRIVPAATPDSLDWASTQIGLRDEAALVCEPFTQWVIEDRFVTDRPSWELAGAMIVSDVAPFQDMKLRLLNAAHSAIAYLGQMGDLATVADVMAHPLLSNYIQVLMREELLAVTPIPPGYPAENYINDLLHRFENPALAHRTEQIAMDGTQKIAVRWLPALRESVRVQRPLPHLEFALATWLHYLETAQSAQNRPLVIQDPGAEALQSSLRKAQGPLNKVRGALTFEGTFGPNNWPFTWVERISRLLGLIQTQGLMPSLSALTQRR